MKRVLIVIDMQNDFIDGPLGTAEAQMIVPKVQAKIAKAATSADTQIFFTKDTHWDNYLKTPEGIALPIEHCIFNTEGWMIHKGVFPEGMEESNVEIFYKYTFGFERWGRYIDPWITEEIELCGVCTDICVINNAIILKTIFPDIKIIVDASCCAGTSPEMHEAALRIMKQCQIEIRGE